MLAGRTLRLCGMCHAFGRNAYNAGGPCATLPCNAKKGASSFRALMLIGVAVAFCAASTPHMMKPIVAIATKSITSWSNAPNDQQYGLYEKNTLNDQEGVLYEVGVPGDRQGVLCEIGACNESSATKEAFEVTPARLADISRSPLPSPESSPPSPSLPHRKP
eukprot:scaffold5379_cov58-Phaeocystis_antarctica.AAC.1